tara:strand:+ start:87 stop:233 length:147 start_codon:yes stop_codon:yes gene_type:complete
MEMVDENLRPLWDHEGLREDAKGMWIHRRESQGRFPRNGDNLVGDETK